MGRFLPRLVFLLRFGQLLAQRASRICDHAVSRGPRLVVRRPSFAHLLEWTLHPDRISLRMLWICFVVSCSSFCSCGGFSLHVQRFVPFVGFFSGRRRSRSRRVRRTHFFKLRFFGELAGLLFDGHEQSNCSSCEHTCVPCDTWEFLRTCVLASLSAESVLDSSRALLRCLPEALTEHGRACTHQQCQLQVSHAEERHRQTPLRTTCWTWSDALRR